MNIKYVRADKLNLDPRLEMSMIFVEGFKQFFKVLLLDDKIIAKAFSHAFDLKSFYLAVVDNKIRAMAACTNGKSPVKFDKYICCKELGLFRGLIVYNLLTKFITNHKFPFSFNSHMGRIDIVATSKEFRGKGLSYNLLTYLMEDTPYKEHVLDVLADNPGAIKLYKKLGFEIFHKVKMPFGIRLVIKDFLYMKRIK